MPITLEYGKCITVDKGGEGVLFFKNLVSLVSETLRLWVPQRLVFSRPGRSQGLLYKHLCNSFVHSLIQ